MSYLVLNHHLTCLPRTDTDNELKLVARLASEAGAYCGIVSNHWAKGGLGALDMARALISQKPKNQFRFLYPLEVCVPGVR